jgi:glycosyltransferase involved in cell wall biosynthesis
VFYGAISFLCSVKVLILHQHFKIPQHGGAIRSYYLAKALVEQGISVSVITTHNQKKYQKEIIEGIEVHYLPIPYDNRFGFGARSNSFLKYILGVIRRRDLYGDADICYAISVPLTIGLAALWIRSIKKIPYIFEVGDLWPEAPIQMGFVKNYFFKQALYALEKFVYNRSKAIVALSPAIKKAVELKTSNKKIYHLPNMADVDFYNPERKDHQLEKKFETDGKFVVSYIGALGVANGLDYFLDCARASQKSALPVHFLLCGDGAMLENLKKSAERLQLKNLSIIPFQNRAGVRDIMNVTDASFVCYKTVPVLETGSPNKYFDGLAAGKLIIVNFGGWIKEEIEKQGCGIFVDPFHPTDFVRKIVPFVENEKQLHQFQEQSRALALSRYSRKIVGDRFVKIFKG